MKRSFFICLAVLAALNITALASYHALNLSEPHSQLSIRPQSDALILFGKNRLGVYRFLTFDNWKSLSSYLEAKGLSLSPVVDVPPSIRQGALLQDSKIVWVEGEQRNVLSAPDQESARALFPYVFYRALRPSILGFSIPLSRPSLAR